ncbi:MAG: hypothetical protein CBB60_003675 [Armatimonadetes bacterium Cent15-Ar3]|nr:MAG: hypothetical protein CBB60_003675 [Armatimonadetes bacterium Cent15-Ar3]
MRAFLLAKPAAPFFHPKLLHFTCLEGPMGVLRSHTDEARWLSGNQIHPLSVADAGSNTNWFACGVYAMNGKNNLGESDAVGDNTISLPLSKHE